LVIEDTRQVIVLTMMHFIHFHYIPHCQPLHGPTCCGAVEGVAANQQEHIPRIHIWAFYFELWTAAYTYDMRHLFNGLDVLSTQHGTNGRTLMGQMLHDLSNWHLSTISTGLVCSESDGLTEVLEVHVLKIVALLKRTDEGPAQLRKDILNLYEASAAYEFKRGLFVSRFREDHQLVLEEMKEEYEEVVQDQDGIWTLQIKPDALKVASKL
jgi:hypothetical protein